MEHELENLGHALRANGDTTRLTRKYMQPGKESNGDRTVRTSGEREAFSPSILKILI